MGKFSPTSWDSYIGQEKVKTRLQIKIQAAMARFEQMDHCLLLGESGSGKTSLANLIAGEHNRPFLSIMITPNYKIKTLNSQLCNFEEEEGGGIILFDECHNLTKSQQHYLYSILEDHCISYDNGKKHYFTTPMTIIGATTDERDLTTALRGRFGAPYRLGNYSDKEMGMIVERMAHKVGLKPTVQSCLALGRAAAGSPRQAADLVKTARDIGNMEDVSAILKLAEITSDGLTVDHLAYLISLRNLGGSGGLENLSNHSGRARDDIVTLEKLLVRKGLVEISKSGRQMTSRGLQTLTKVKKGEGYEAG